MLETKVNMEVEEVKNVFVYGSLMNNFFNYERYLRDIILDRKKARVKGKLYHLAKRGYPALVDGKDFVYGELISFKNFKENLKILDKMEGYIRENDSSNEYSRILTDVEVLEGESARIQKAYMYKYNDKNNKIDKNDIYVHHGDWRKFMIQYIS
ncbi:gamma-glutamylcyclotransferase family protein [Clostridium sp. KNHs214]|uniref:gamma-glutamylcyclotransferase family protein n=1 Tax=Clostridium sp. KNHs214 TaxID=1540257 RepID=UPI0005582DF2|nr:gamma-glutamylcyclotransferase family protein [Clostridium sp. KNHs214]